MYTPTLEEVQTLAKRTDNNLVPVFRDVPADLESSLSQIAAEDFPYRHTVEGPDDMPAHVKAVLIGSSVSVPVHQGRLCLGTWQGIYLCEHRNRAQGRNLVLTLQGHVLGLQD